KLCIRSSITPASSHNLPQNGNYSGQRRNNSYIQTTDRLGGQPTTTPTPAPQFEYALLGQDPEDQHWYRVSLTPTGGKAGYRAQFATRKSPPFDAQLAHKHDKTIKELLDFLERSEEHNLLKVYGQLLGSEDEDSKIKRAVDNELERQPEVQAKDLLRTDGGRPLLLVGELSPTANSDSPQNGTTTSMVKNFVYFLKGLK
ncbi:hypothetical protein KR222_004530, partial [Zaprionus bogoriensis]